MSQVSTERGFEDRHIGPSQEEIQSMLNVLQFKSLQDFIDAVVPKRIRQKTPLSLEQFPGGITEAQALQRLSEIAEHNKPGLCCIGMGYSNCITPPVIQRNILENPGWYTQYTPYQPEISQGRLEALMNFQTMITDLTSLAVANASLLDESTAAAEAMQMSYAIVSKQREKCNRFVVADDCHPQTIAVLKTRALGLGIEIEVAPPEEINFSPEVFGVLLQYPGTFGAVRDYRELINAAHEKGALVTMAADILALAVLVPPGELGADIAVGSSQRFGIPLGYGGPHAAYFATKDEFKRLMPGRLVGASKDAAGNTAFRLALQTREQHIRREKATSNICTAQVLLAIMAGMYGVYHGRRGVTAIANRVHGLANCLAEALELAGYSLQHKDFFDTLVVRLATSKLEEVMDRASRSGIGLRRIDAERIGIALDETIAADDVKKIAACFGVQDLRLAISEIKLPQKLLRTSPFLTHPVFERYHSETEFLRYVRRLESRDLSLGTAMIPLGSCTMKLNATSEMLPVSWREFAGLHPFVAQEDARGYALLFKQLEQALAEITGFDAVSLQPNSGAQGEYAGLMVMKAYLSAKGESERDVCLIPRSAHGTNPASAAMAGMRVVVVECDSNGNVDLADLEKKALQHSERLAALMVTYPSTHGVFEESIQDICEIIHNNGGQVYLDGANMNALVGIARPADFGADVCHINLHKTFCIPHGGGGPGMGPIAVKSHLEEFLPSHPIVDLGHAKAVGPVSAAPWGSASILTIPWMYLALMGGDGLTRATQVAILNANYVAWRLRDHFPVLYRGKSGFVAHECIIDLRALKKSANVEVDDVAKRLMDYGFHAPTVSWPVPGTIMIEPTESESKIELDRFCDALIAIHAEAGEVAAGKYPADDNPLKNAPHTALEVVNDDWSHPYSRVQAAFPTESTRHFKFWPAVGRIDSAYGDKNLVCTCPDIDSYQ
ncbi:MAG: aminomethyl-transferring glycine dehydrogenase [Bdellovibrionales bacterium]|nr:aminomethyl-transferring glycine dehydrogenase [Bdellovibrionales bacterium]